MPHDVVWITLPFDRKDKIQNMLESFKDAPRLSIHEFIKFAELKQSTEFKEKVDSQAKKKDDSTEKDNPMGCWLEGAANIYCFESLTQIVNGAKAIRDRFNEKDKKTGQLIHPNLNDKKFPMNQFIGLFILHFSGPDLIGSNLCQALNDDNFYAIKEEFLENSMKVKRKGDGWILMLNPDINKRLQLVSESEVNLRLFSYALFSKDVYAMLPFKTIGKMTGRLMIDPLGGLRVRANYIDTMVQLNLLEKECLQTLKKFNLGWGDVDLLFENKQDRPRSKKSIKFKQEFGQFNGTKDLEIMENDLIFTRLPQQGQDNVNAVNKSLIEFYKPSMAHANEMDLGNVLMGGLVFWNIVTNTPMGAIARNIRSDVITAGNYIGTFFSKNTLKSSELQGRQEQEFEQKETHTILKS